MNNKGGKVKSLLFEYVAEHVFNEDKTALF